MQIANEKGLIVQSKPGAVPVFKRYLDEQEGNPVGDIWSDVPPVQAQSDERLGYPTQKPVALLERILSASSNPGDVVLDPFCGCGTTVHAAQKLGRQWIGIDVTHLAIGLIEKRLRNAYRERPHDLEFTIHGVPQDIEGARAFFGHDDKTKKEFEKWALSLIGAQPWRQGKKGADGGIDGILPFGTTSKAIVSVKGGNVGVSMVRELADVVTSAKADIGVFLTLEEPTKPMKERAASAGRFKLDGYEGDVPRIQIITVEEAMRLRDRAVKIPLRFDSYKKAAPEVDVTAQGKLEL